MRHAGLIGDVKQQRLKKGFQRICLGARKRIKFLDALRSQACSKYGETSLKQLVRKHMAKATVTTADDDDAAISRNTTSAESEANQKYKQEKQNYSADMRIEKFRQLHNDGC
jgi:hypothetical protein